jgi:hypothetical protein
MHPLSVSTDLISLPAMRTMALLLRHGVTDRSGDGRFYEVYPAASLNCWDIKCEGYKQKNERNVRNRVVDMLQGRLQIEGDLSKYAETDHAIDALIASLTVRAAAKGLTVKPEGGQVALAKSEG